MERKVICPGCKCVQAGLVVVDGKLYTMQDEQRGTRVLGYVCSSCGRRVHYGERDNTKIKARWSRVTGRQK